MKIISLFSGCGGLDLGFTNAGFKLVFSNDNDKDVWETFEKNHKIKIDRRSIVNVKSSEIPNADGIIGGPPCQAWSLAGAMRGIKDERGKVFYEYIRILREKQPKFFLAENVPGILSSTHKPEFLKIIKEFEKIGYDITFGIVNASDYGVPQDRKRVIVVGYRKDFGKRFEFPLPLEKKVTLKEAIGDLPEPLAAKERNYANQNLDQSNHEYMNGGFSFIYMSRNRKKSWIDQSFTIQAGGRHAPLHPSSSDMLQIDANKWVFEGKSPKFRRLSVRECARIQTFPDNFVFYYDNVSKGYKMIGNAVPVRLAEAIALKIVQDLKLSTQSWQSTIRPKVTI